MKTAKLVLGILSLVFSMVVLFQSCAAGLGSALANKTNDTSGSTGIFVAILLIAGGIVAIAARKSKGGAIAASIIYALAGILGVASSGIYADLIVWGVFCLIIAAVFVVSIFKQDYSAEAPKKQ